MGSSRPSDRNRIIVAVALTVSGSLCVGFHQNTGAPTGILGGILLLAAVFAWAHTPKAEDDGPPAFSEPMVVSESADPNEAVQILAGSGVNVAQGLLRSAGIPAFLKSSHPSIHYPDWSNPNETGDLLMIPRSYLAQASEILNSRISGPELAAQAETELPPEDRPGREADR